MASAIVQEPGKKRKRPHSAQESIRKRKSAPRAASNSAQNFEAWESAISKDPLKSQQQAEKLFGLFNTSEPETPTNPLIELSLCKIYVRLSGPGKFFDPSKTSSHEDIRTWYFQKFESFRRSLAELCKISAPSTTNRLLQIYWTLIQADADALGPKIWTSGSPLETFLDFILESSRGSDGNGNFLIEHMNRSQDFCFYTLKYLATYIAACTNPQTLDYIIELLSHLETPPPMEEFNFLVTVSRESKGPVATPASIKRRVEKAWLSLLQSSHVAPASLKQLLRSATTVILPWMTRPETLMDFFTDRYNLGGSTALLALSGLFHLISAKNLDYPSFYPKLYSLIDADLLHSKHRSRFLRLLNTFLASPRLPASLIASFIKQLSRRALFAPPAAIVAIVPYIYNLLKAHPTCTFMIHRIPHPPYTKTTDNLGHDPFDMNEPNPQKSDAISSSLWELETLQSHYHPNVASIARIISEQFTKQQYNIEDFLDHGYKSMIESELGKEPKKEPVVEWRIPKRILTGPEEDEPPDDGPQNLITKLWTF